MRGGGFVDKKKRIKSQQTAERSSEAVSGKVKTDDTAENKADEPVENKADNNVSEISKGSKDKRKRVDIIPMIVCVLFAIVIWYYVMQVDSPDYQEVFHDIDVNLSNTAVLENERNLYVYSGYGYTVDITVSGKKSVISKYTADDITVTADLSNITEAGEYQAELQIKLPTGLTLVKPDYNSILVYVDEKETVSLPVESRITGATYSGEYEYGELTPEYDSIVVLGPKSEIDKLSSAVVSVDLSSLGVIKESTVSVCQISVVNKDGETVTNPYIKLSRTEMRVTLPVYTYKELPLKVSFVNGYLNERNSTVTINPPAVRVKGDPVVLQKYENLTVANIDEKTLAADTVSTFELEKNSDFTYENPTSVEVTVQHVGTVVKTYNVTNIKIVGTKGICVPVDKTVNVTLRGTPEQLEKITANDITLEADASEYANDYSGTAKLPAAVKISGENTDGVYELNSYSIQVKIK